MYKKSQVRMVITKELWYSRLKIKSITSGNKMSERKRTTDDEIDLIELFEILWNSKLFILTVTILTTIVGFAYTQFSKPIYIPNYKISVPYVNQISYGSSNEAKLSFILDPSWTLKDSRLTKTEKIQVT